MKRATLALMLALTCSGLVVALYVNVALANPGPFTQIPPVVRVPEMQVTTSISEINGELWAKVDAKYQMNTIYAFGESYLTENWGMSTLIDPSRFVTVTVAYDRLDAQYPVPSNATNISVEMDDATLEYTLTKRTYHLLDDNLPELHWILSPVPRNFSIATHYEHPVSTTDQTYSYLGKNAFVIPLGARYGLQEIIDYSFNENPWFGHSTTAQIKLKMEFAFTNVSAYTIDGFGSLKPLSYALIAENGTERVELVVSGEAPSYSETTLPYGVVVFFDDPLETSEPFPTVPVSAASAIVIVIVAAGLLVYFKKRKCALDGRWKHATLTKNLFIRGYRRKISQQCSTPNN